MIDPLAGLDLSYRYNQDLREVLNSPGDVERACGLLRESLQQSGVDQAKVFGQLGVYLRLLGKLEEAEYCLIKSVRTLESTKASASRVIAAWLRLAHVYQWQQRYAEAGAIFAATVEEARRLEDQGELESFALQHAGKNLFDQARYAEAQRFFEQALMIRERLNNADLIQSSRVAVARAQELQKKN